MADINLRRLAKVYPGGVRALDDLELAVRDGEFFALLGPSGCGKSTLLRTIAGLEGATGGSIEIGGRDVTGLEPGARDIAMVFQDYALFPHMTVTENIGYPLKIKKVGKAERAAKAAETADALGLGHLGDRRPAQLSGGQQQRVALARAMACHPKVFLFDEPLSNLDARMRLEARTFLKKLQRELGVTTVFVTHDQAEALAMADRIAVMEGGRLRQVGTPAEVFRRPASTFVASFIGSTPMNLLPATAGASAVHVLGAELPLPDGIEPGTVRDGEEIVYGIRPEYVRWAAAEPSDAAALTGTVSVVENLGSAHLVSLDVDGTTVQAVVDEEFEPAVGDRGRIVPRTDRALLYRDGTLVETRVDSENPEKEGVPA
ncbi:ATP-binding cassette domain-containing protein [Streptomyces sp. SID8379]|uniref:ABC transporter ATP-binding protein n=1 Tax=unclassified Streptomyces TaxID=2593676 RepID=UPI00036137E2|nr:MULTISPECIES: ABC transporter ATP-binding protein [unclassified Streptomyces]MYW63161.1 ATP-binding cassette domain-containing protein [Streptomyces sp. SID8379]